MNDILDIEKMRYTVRSYSDKKLEQVVLLLLRYPTEESKPKNTMSGKRLPIEKTVFYNQYPKE